MKLIKLSVKGEYGCEYNFDKINVILGDNNTGKSTFLKLILYSLGAPIKSFIDEINKLNLCDNVSLDIEFKTGKRVRILRKLPNSDAIIVTPIKESEDLVNDEIVAYSTTEFSDFLLENEGYSIDKITYAKDKMASFRFYFLLRAIYVDQDTSAQSILSDLDMGNDYFTSQPTIKKSIVEKLLGKDNSELQRIRMEIQSTTKEQAETSDRISFLEEELAEIESHNEINKSKLTEELVEIGSEKKALASQEYKKISSVQTINDSQTIQLDISRQSRLNQLFEQQRTISLELRDIQEVIDSLNGDMVLLKYKVAAKDILEELPLLYCPNCLSELNEETIKKGLCENCQKKTVEEKVINSATLKKTISDSLAEAREIQQIKTNELVSVKKEIEFLQREIRLQQEAMFEQNREANDLIYKAIFEIKKRLEYLLSREQILRKYQTINSELEMLKSRIRELNSKISELKNELLNADTTASLSMQFFVKFKENFKRYLNCMFDEVNACDLDENYMPIVDKTKMTAVASASLKVAIRLSYTLALFNESIDSEEELGNHLGFLLLDSPKDKDLDNNRFDNYLRALNEEAVGQVIITGSISDEHLYRTNLTNAIFFDALRTNDKLLKKQA